jgi:hypothetical protein
MRIAKVRMFSTRIVELDQWNTGSALNSRSPEVWRKTRRRERFCYLSDVSQCAGRVVRAPIYSASTRLVGTRRNLDAAAVAVQEDFERLHKFLLETEGLPEVSDDMRELVEDEWPELVHKLPPKVSQSG